MRPTDRYVASRLDDLTAAQVHDVLRLRQQVFIVEQDCVFADIDGLDRVAWHLLAFAGGELAACLRVLPPGAGGEDVAISRIAVCASRRRAGLGRYLVQRGVEAAQQQFGVRPIRLAAQVRLVDFYASLEALHGLKLELYLAAGNETRRLLWTLAHAHGTLLSLLHLVFGLTARDVMDWEPRRLELASRCLLAASVLLPGGFLLGGAVVYDGDPGLGVLLVPPGGLLLFAAVLLAARTPLRKGNR